MSNKPELPKPISFFDKLKYNIRKLFGYRDGEKFILDIKPEIKEYTQVQLMQLANIEEKLQTINKNNNINNSLENGIKESEAISLLEWVVQNARNYLVSNEKNLSEESLLPIFRQVVVDMLL